MTKKQLNFEKSLKRLEEIVSDMENGEPDLDTALSLFSEGAHLVKSCSQKLSETKKKIEIITASGEVKSFEE
ncbi:MAG: exodeoxyribonuclease VII small subunit [Endomicrobium sp.]|jgi:exodeoxyribonuclease VII small subunit|nr:exodeoxyribonuclease VII small subunit [Endomicrobium sp.]